MGHAVPGVLTWDTIVDSLKDVLAQPPAPIHPFCFNCTYWSLVACSKGRWPVGGWGNSCDAWEPDKFTHEDGKEGK
jgi:hypothetical protein